MATTKTTTRKKTFNPEDEAGMMIPPTKEQIKEMIEDVAKFKAQQVANKKKTSVA